MPEQENPPTVHQPPSFWFYVFTGIVTSILSTLIIEYIKSRGGREEWDAGEIVDDREYVDG